MIKINFFFVSTFSTFFCIKGNLLLPVTDVNPVNINDLTEIFQLAFRKGYCIQVIGDELLNASGLVKIFHHLPLAHTFLIGIKHSFEHYDRIYVASNLEIFCELLKKYPLVKRKFIGLITDNFSVHSMNQLKQQEGSNYLHNSDGIIVNLKKSNLLFIYSPLHNVFKEVMLSDDKLGDIGINYGNFENKELRVGTFNCTVDSQFGPLDSEGKPNWIDGVELKFFDEITRKLNFSYKIILPTDGGKVGTIDKDGNWYGGLMQMLGEKTVDIAFCGIWLTGFKRSSSIDITSTTNEVCVTFLVRRPLPFSQMGLGLLNSFHWQVWVGVVVQMLMVTIFIRVITFLSAKIPLRNEHILIYLKIDNILFILWEILCNNAPKSNVIFGPLRHVFVWWAILSLLLNTSFSSSLIAHLTRTLYAKPYDSLQELVEHDYQWCSSYTPMFDTIFDLNDPWGKKWVGKYCLADGEKQCQLLKEEDSNYAILAVRYYDGVLTDEDLNCKKVLSHYQTLPECINKYRTAFMLQANSPYTDIFSDYITRYHESGLFRKQYRDLLWKMTLEDKYIHEVRITNDKKKVDRMKLKLPNILLVFYIFWSGLILSSSIFFIEHLWFHRRFLVNFFNCQKYRTMPIEQ